MFAKTLTKAAITVYIIAAILGIVSMLCGCQQVPVQAIITPQEPTIPQPVQHNPFETLFAFADESLTLLTDNAKEIILIKGGFDVISILLDKASQETKLRKLYRLPHSPAKTMFFDAAGGNIETITKVSAIYGVYQDQDSTPADVIKTLLIEGQTVPPSGQRQE